MSSERGIPAFSGRVDGATGNARLRWGRSGLELNGMTRTEPNLGSRDPFDRHPRAQIGVEARGRRTMYTALAMPGVGLLGLPVLAA